MEFYDYLNNPHELPEGEQVFWRLSGYSIVRDNENKVLVIKPMNRETYDFPGGGIELPESISSGIIRECYEESGYKIKLESAYPIYFSETNFYHTGKNKYYRSVNMFFNCSLVSNVPDSHVVNTVVPEEVAEVEWKDISELNSDNMHEFHYDALKVLRDI